MGRGRYIRLCHQVDRIPSACAARRQVRKSSRDYCPVQKRSKLIIENKMRQVNKTN